MPGSMDPSPDLQPAHENHQGESVPKVAGAWTKGVVHAFRRLGLDVEALCDEIGVDLGEFVDTTSRSPRDAGGRLWRAALEASGDRFLGLSAAEQWEARADHLVFLLLLSADTFGEGLTASIRFQELLSHGRVITLGEHPRHHAVCLNKIEHELPMLSHEVEFLAAILVKLFRFATDDVFTLEEVHFDHPYRGNMEQYRRAFGAPVLFGQNRSALIVNDASWNLSMAHGDPLLHRQLGDMAAGLHAELPNNSFLDSVRDRIKGLLPKGNCGIESVAASLHTTPRTLQRRLREEGTTFRDVMDAARRAIVLDCVARRQPPDEIVRHAGYTNHRSFRRAMKRWNL